VDEEDGFVGVLRLICSSDDAAFFDGVSNARGEEVATKDIVLLGFVSERHVKVERRARSRAGRVC
jgi:hypothetical protein